LAKSYAVLSSWADNQLFTVSNKNLPTLISQAAVSVTRT